MIHHFVVQEKYFRHILWRQRKMEGKGNENAVSEDQINSKYCSHFVP